MADGRVEVLAQGDREAIDRLEGLLREQPSTARRPGHVQSVVVQWGGAKDGVTGFAER
jgi:acylphosphatase